MDTVWVLGDQLHRALGALGASAPGEVRVLMVESASKIAARPYHRQRLHLVLTAMRRFADELRGAGYDVDHRRAATFEDGLAAHRRAHRPGTVRATEPLTRGGRRMLERNDVELVRTNQMLCHYDDFAEWASDQRRLRMEDFYRWRRRATGYMMDGDEPAGGRWNFDAENRRPPPSDGADCDWPAPVVSRLDDVDAEVLASLPDGAPGAEPVGLWATSRRAALARLRHVVRDVLPRFGPHQDAMLTDEWRLAHSLLSPSLNLGLLLPVEVCDAVEDAYRAGDAPIASAEGFLRQVLGWREYVWGVYWLWGPHYRSENALDAHRPLPPVFGDAPTAMQCVASALAGVHERAYAHHIQRLMVLGNLCLLTGVEPTDLVEWMHASLVDGADWVMLPNVVGMALHADGGRMATKPYAGGGAYVNRMSDHCRSCRYDPRRRTGDDACPYTTLYWDFLARHRDRFARNHRMGQQLRGLDRLSDLDDVRSRAREVLAMLDAGAL